MLCEVRKQFRVLKDSHCILLRDWVGSCTAEKQNATLGSTVNKTDTNSTGGKD